MFDNNLNILTELLLIIINEGTKLGVVVANYHFLLGGKQKVPPPPFVVCTSQNYHFCFDVAS